MPIRVLYITYDGLTDALGQSQVLAYLRHIHNVDYEITILSFEKEERYKLYKYEIHAITSQSGIRWIPKTYTHWPPVVSTIKDLYIAWKTIRQLQPSSDIDIIHCRGYIAALLGYYAKKYYRIPYIFDMRGWWPDEKKESGAWRNAFYRPVYEYFKCMEKKFFKYSDSIISLTHRGKAEIVGLGIPPERVVVIPTCVDTTVFSEKTQSNKYRIRSALHIPPEAKVLIYSGALGGSYSIQPIAFAIESFISLNENNYCIVLSKDGVTHPLFVSPRVHVLSVPYNEVAQYLHASDIGLLYYETTYSAIGRCPTKLGEYWACGLPVISKKGAGDLDQLFTTYPNGGELVTVWDKYSLSKAFERVLARSSQNCREYAENYFGLNKGVESYKKVYQAIKI